MEKENRLKKSWIMNSNWHEVSAKITSDLKRNVRKKVWTRKLMSPFSSNNNEHRSVLFWVFPSVYFCVGPKHLSGHQVISPFLREKWFRRWLMELMESHFSSSDAWKQVILKIDLLFLVAIDHTLKVSHTEEEYYINS